MPIPGALPFIASTMLGAGNIASQMSMPSRQYKWNKRAAEDANAMNRDNQQWLLQQQKDIQAEQREYDSPQAAMKRFIAAGLNPHMIYGNGSSVGQAFPINAPALPPARIDAPSAANPDFLGAYLGAARGTSALELTGAKTAESLMKSQAIAIQNEIAKTNPMLNPSVAEAVYSSMEKVAMTKGAEAELWRTHMGEEGSFQFRKIAAEVQSLEQKLGLNTTDLAIKNRILESKEFENAIKDIQLKWLKDGDLNAEHIRQGLMLILTKMLGR